jgi:PAS domain S-box-containing protein
MVFEDPEGMAQALFEQTGDALVVFEPDTQQILNANSTVQRLSGFAVRDLLRMTVPDLFRSANEDGWTQFLKASRNATVFHSEEGYFLKTVKEEVWVPVNLSVARLHVRPKPVSLITARDVRRQHAAYSELKRMEAELRGVLASVSDCLWSAEIDETGKCTYHFLSDVVEKITGLPPDFFLVGFHRWYSIVHPEDQPRWSQAVARQRAGQSTLEEYRVVWPDGASRWVREKVGVRRGTAVPGAIRLEGVLTDIGDRKHMERRLQDAEERFQAFMGHSPLRVYIKDADGRYFYVNPPFHGFFQKQAAEVISRKDSEVFSAEVAQRLSKLDERAHALGKAIQTVDMVPGPDGTARSWFVTRFPFKDSSGRRFLGGLAVDVDELYQLQRQTRNI